MIHIIDYDISTGTQPAILQILIDGIHHHINKHSADSDCSNNIKLDYDYNTDGLHMLTVVFAAVNTESLEKFLRLKTININNQSLNINIGSYQLNKSAWLDTQDDDFILDCTLTHNGYFAWYGNITYTFNIQTNMDNTKLSKVTHMDLFNNYQIIKR